MEKGYNNWPSILEEKEKMKDTKNLLTSDFQLKKRPVATIYNRPFFSYFPNYRCKPKASKKVCSAVNITMAINIQSDAIMAVFIILFLR